MRGKGCKGEEQHHHHIHSRVEWVAFLTLKASLSTLFLAALGKFDNRQVGACKSRHPIIPMDPRPSISTFGFLVLTFSFSIRPAPSLLLLNLLLTRYSLIVAQQTCHRRNLQS
jgi:hypothetical protein